LVRICVSPKVMKFEILGKIENVEIIAIGNAIRELPRLRKIYGDGRWRKLKVIAAIRLDKMARFAM
ncbi:MAG: hypothetical protein ACKPCM_01365, partial [Pseudanabaena sp.]